MKIKQIRKKLFPASLFGGGTQNFPLGEAKSQWEYANYRWGTRPSYNLSSGYMALFHYYATATVRNQRQLLTCKTSKWESLLFKKLLFTNYHQKLNEMQYTTHFRA